MLLQGNLLLWALALVLFLMLVRAIARVALTTATVQTRRRCKRNHRRIVSRARRRPMVMLSVRTAKA